MEILAIAEIYLLMLVPFCLVLACIMYVLRNRSATTRRAAFVVSATVLCTPGWGPVTIAIAPMPFGLLLVGVAIDLHWGELIDVMRLAPPYWYIVAFPVTAVAAYGFWKWVSSKRSSNGTPTSVA